MKSSESLNYGLGVMLFNAIESENRYDEHLVGCDYHILKNFNEIIISLKEMEIDINLEN